MPTLLAATGLYWAYGERVILDDVSLSLASGERLALLGRNGAGKTTLLRLLSGELRPEVGEVWHAQPTRVATLAQHFPDADGTVQTLITAANPYRAAEIELLSLEAQLEAPGALERWGQLRESLDQAQAWTWPSRTARMLDILQLQDKRQQAVSALSGGERTRLALALALAQEPQLLLLDEPTNHLDIRMRQWLEATLRAFRGGVVLTSHDRDFLDAVATRSLWIAQGEAVAYAGGYSRAAAQRDLEGRSVRRSARLGRREQQRLQGRAEWLDQRGKESRALKTRAERLEIPQAPQAERALHMRLLAGTSQARLLLWAEHVAKAYGSRWALSEVALKVRQGDRIALMGANGTGKSTLLRLLAGELAPDPGPPQPILRLAQGAQVAYLEQHWHGLVPDVPLLTQFEARFGKQARAILGRSGLAADFWDRPPQQLSGGERARAGLALVGTLRSDLLLLDEPTNHLDIEALTALQDALAAYPGAVIVVTHDRRFAREIANRFWLIEEAQLREVEGWGSDLYLDPARHLMGDPPPEMPALTPRDRMGQLERELLDIRRQLDEPGRLSGREEARLRASAHRLGQGLYELYAEVYGAEQWEHECWAGPLRIRAQRLGERGGMFWAAGAQGCPHLAWDGETLRLSGPMSEWFGRLLLAGALETLFLRWNVGRVRLGEGGGETLTRRRYFELLGIVGRRTSRQ